MNGKREPAVIHIDSSTEGEPLNIRNHCFGQAALTDQPLSPAVVRRLAALRPPLLRIFVQEYFRMMAAPGRYHWETVDRAVASVIATGATPLLALCMKPACLFPRVDHSITTPSDWRAWEDFIEAMARHFAHECGWPGIWYEVGNEPNIGEVGGSPYLFDPAAYGEYYARTVRAVRRGDPAAKVGGPALAGPLFLGQGNAWPGAFARRVLDERLPLDFFSWHTYTPNAEELEASVREVVAHTRALGEPFAFARTVLDEWNITYNCSLQPGEYVQAAFLVDAVARLLTTGLDYSCYFHVMDCLPDPVQWRGWFSAGGFAFIQQHWCSPRRALHLLTPDGEASAPFAAFQMLYALEGRKLTAGRISPSIGYLATRQCATVHVLVWNYHHATIMADTVALQIAGLPPGALRERTTSLGGMDRLLEDLDALQAIRHQAPRVTTEQRHAPTPVFVKQLAVSPFSVHLIELVAGA